MKWTRHIFFAGVVACYACGNGAPDARVDDALKFYRARQFPEALAVIEKILDRDGDNTQALFLAARIYFYQKEFDQSEDFCERILAEHPDHTGAMLQLARSMSQVDNKRNQEALRLADRVLEIDPGNVEAWFLKGSLHESQNEIQEAFVAYRAAIHAGNNLALVHARLAALYTKADLPEQANLHGTMARLLGPRPGPPRSAEPAGAPGGFGP